MTKDLHKAFSIIANHFAGLELSENPTSDTYTPEKGSIENMIRGCAVASKRAYSLLAQIASRLTGKMRAFTGKEVEDTSIQSDTRCIKKLQEQIAVNDSFIEAGSKFYKDHFGMTYTENPRVFNPEAMKSQTQAVKDAVELLSQIQAKKKVA